MLKVEARGMKNLLSGLQNASDNLPKELNIALGLAANKVKSLVAKEINRELNVKQKVIKKQVERKLDRNKVTASVIVKKSSRIPLKEFQAKQDRQGVKAKISKRRGQKLYKSAFIIGKFGDHVFHRPNNGRRISKLKGPSPYGIVKNNDTVTGIIVDASRQEVLHQIERRVRFLNLKKTGGLNWQEQG
jgi:hypothetical protein